MSEQITITHERTDDIPVIIAFLLKMRVAELIDKHFPTNGNWTGLSLGQMLVVWLTFIISEGDHRLYHVEPWVAAHQHTLSRSLHQEVLPRDCTDDRLATGLDYLCVAENWAECECALNQNPHSCLRPAPQNHPCGSNDRLGLCDTSWDVPTRSQQGSSARSAATEDRARHA